MRTMWRHTRKEILLFSGERLDLHLATITGHEMQPDPSVDYSDGVVGQKLK